MMRAKRLSSGSAQVPNLSRYSRLGLLVLGLLTPLLFACGGGEKLTSDPTGSGTPSAGPITSPVAQALPTTPPAVPTGLLASSGNGEVALSWNDVVGATSYTIYYLPYPGVTTGNARQLTNAVSGEPLTGLTNTVTYYFRVTASNAAGESAATAEIAATPMPAVPGIPGNVRLSGGLGEATVSWQAVPYATSYNIYYGTTPGVTTSNGLSIKGITLTSKKITGLNAAPGHYYFMVTAVGPAGEGAPSVERAALAKSAYKAVAAGYGHSSAIRIIDSALALVNNGTVWEWGDNSSGQLGDGTNTAKLTAKMTPTIESVTGIAAGYHHTIALKTDASVANWGLNGKGQIGDNNTTANYNQPKTAFIRNPAMTAVAGGYQHTAALRDDGTVWTWGFNPMGALGYKSLNCESPTDVNQPEAWTCSFTPTQVSGINGLATAVAAGFGHTLAVTSDGSVWGWGRNDTGQLGSEYPNCDPSLTAATPDAVGFTADWAFPTTAYTCSTLPVPVAAFPGAITAVAAGTRHSVALMSDGTVWTWGGNRFGQLGYTPSQNCVITSAFQMACSTTPQQVPGLDHVIAIAAGSDHSIALKNDGTVWSWGYNLNGQIVNGEVIGGSYNQTPAQVQGVTNVTAIAAGAYHSVVLRNDGTAWAWGYNGHGQLGDGSKIDRTTPVQVQGLLGPVVIVPGM